MRLRGLAPLAMIVGFGCSGPPPAPMSATIVAPIAAASAAPSRPVSAAASAKPAAGDDDEWESDPKKSPRQNCLSHCAYAADKCVETVTRVYPGQSEYLEGCANQQSACPDACPP